MPTTTITPVGLDSDIRRLLGACTEFRRDHAITTERAVRSSIRVEARQREPVVIDAPNRDDLPVGIDRDRRGIFGHIGIEAEVEYDLTEVPEGRIEAPVRQVSSQRPTRGVGESKEARTAHDHQVAILLDRDVLREDSTERRESRGDLAVTAERWIEGPIALVAGQPEREFREPIPESSGDDLSVLLDRDAFR